MYCCDDNKKGLSLPSLKPILVAGYYNYTEDHSLFLWYTALPPNHVAVARPENQPIAPMFSFDFKSAQHFHNLLKCNLAKFQIFTLALIITHKHHGR